MNENLLQAIKQSDTGLPESYLSTAMNEKIFQKMELSDTILPKLNSLGIEYFKKGQLFEAFTIFELRQDYLPILNNLSFVCLTLSKHKKAYPLIMEALQMNENSPHALFNLGYYYILMEKYDLALINITRAKELGLFGTGTEFNIGKCNMKLENYDEAIINFLNVINTPSTILNKKVIRHIHHRIGLCYLSKGEGDKSIYHLKLALPEDKSEALKKLLICHEEFYKKNYQNNSLTEEEKQEKINEFATLVNKHFSVGNYRSIVNLFFKIMRSLKDDPSKVNNHVRRKEYREICNTFKDLLEPFDESRISEYSIYYDLLCDSL